MIKNKITYYPLFSIFLILSIFSCTRQTPQDTTQIRGKIVNPKSDQIIISRDFLAMTADTLKMIAANEVKGKVKTPVEGLYFLQIFPEFQTIYLKPGDSLAFHINIDEFDESLSFSGSLGFENNLLIAFFLENEKESDYFYKQKFDFTTAEFIKKLDSFSQIKHQLINNYQEEFNRTSRKYKKIINLLDNSLQYSLKETYLKKHPDVTYPEDFTRFESVLKTNLPDPNIIYMYAFADNYLDRKISRSKPEINTYFEIAKLINQEIKDRDFRDNMLIKYCNRYLKVKLLATADTTLKYFQHSIQNPVYKNHCRKLLQKNKQIQPGHIFPNISVTDLKRTSYKIQDSLKNKKYLISFWDIHNRKNLKSNLQKLKEIHQNFPGLHIIILNLNPELEDTWLLSSPQNTNFSFLQVGKTPELNLVKPYHLSQVFLVHKGQIKKSLCNMYEPDFYQNLQEFMLSK